MISICALATKLGGFLNDLNGAEIHNRPTPNPSPMIDAAGAAGVAKVSCASI